jgi:hypothetical protein
MDRPWGRLSACVAWGVTGVVNELQFNVQQYMGRHTYIQRHDEYRNVEAVHKWTGPRADRLDTQISRMYIHIHSHGTTRCKQRRLELNQLSLGGTRNIHAKASVVVRERRRVGYRRLQKELSRVWWGPWSLFFLQAARTKQAIQTHITSQHKLAAILFEISAYPVGERSFVAFAF